MTREQLLIEFTEAVQSRRALWLTWDEFHNLREPSYRWRLVRDVPVTGGWL